MADYPGQDAEYGRDVTHSDNSDGHAGLSFTKLDANGIDLPASAAEWSCVRDNVTGLVWEVKTDDGGLHDHDWEYTWYNPDTTSNGGHPGNQDGGICEGSTCDTFGYVQAVNAQGLYGANDWRLPAREELRSIVSYDRGPPSIDIDYFPNTVSTTLYWSGSPSASSTSDAWYVSFYLGFDYTNSKGNDESVRLVRGGQPALPGITQAVSVNQICVDTIPSTAPNERYVVHGDGTVTDVITSLMWKRCPEGQSGVECIEGVASQYTWQEALQRAPLSDFAGYTDWRLPNIKELASLVEMRCDSPSNSR